jgi:predicted GNAT family acetyltransferase
VEEAPVEVDLGALVIRNNEAEGQFEVEVGGQLALLAYLLRGSTIIYPHTLVPVALEGHGIAGKLSEHAMEYARANGLMVVPRCPYVRAYVNEHPEYDDLIERR